MIERRTVVFVMVLLALMVGFGGGFLFGRARSERLQFVYRSKVKIATFNKDDSLLGVLPVGTPILSPIKIEPRSDFGWWGYVPVYLHGMSDANDLLRQVDEDPVRLSVMEMLHGRDVGKAQEPTQRAPAQRK